MTVSNFGNDDGWANQWYSLSDSIGTRRIDVSAVSNLEWLPKPKMMLRLLKNERSQEERRTGCLMSLCLFFYLFPWVVVAAAVLLIGMIISRVEQIRALLREYHNRINRLEVAKYDMEFEVKKKDFEVHNTRHTSFTLFTQ